VHVIGKEGIAIFIQLGVDELRIKDGLQDFRISGLRL
jgi:hypothetical protein